jgi:hypothetical protein
VGYILEECCRKELANFVDTDGEKEKLEAR